MIEYIQFGSIYLIIALLFLLVQLAPIGFNRNTNFLLNRFLGASILTFLFILTAFRHEDIGTDTQVYIEIFEWFQLNDFNGRYELLFSEITRYLGKITDDFRLFLVVFSLFAYLPIYFFLKIESKNVAYSAFLFFVIFFIDYVTMMRQAVATSIVMIGLVFLQKNKLKNFYLCILVAIGFHYSAFIGLLFPILKNITFSIMRAFMVMAFAFLLAFTKAFSSVIDALGFNTKYIEDDPASGILVVVYLIFFLSTLFILRICGHKYNNDQNNQSPLNLYLWLSVGCVVCHIFTLDMPVFFRISYYFAISFLIIVPYAISGFERQKKIFLLWICYPLFFVAYQFIIFYFRPQWGEVFPYQFG